MRVGATDEELLTVISAAVKRKHPQHAGKLDAVSCPYTVLSSAVSPIL